MSAPFADFANSNAGLWALIALPFIVAASVEPGVALFARLRAAVASGDRNLELLRKQLRRRRIELEMDQRLVLGVLLEAQLQSTRGGASLTAGQLYTALEEGAQVLVAGAAGSGKSMLGLTLVKLSVERSEADSAHPLMDVISLRDWHANGPGSSDWKRLLSWIARRLSDSYPAFGTDFFKELLRDQRLIPCLDGLDEMSQGARKEAKRALSAYAEAGFPLLVLSRSPAAISTRVEEENGLPPSFDRLELRSPRDATLAELAEWPTWEKMMANARQPHRAAVLLSNPLRLSIAALTWNDRERADALADSDDPERDLWETFFRRRLGAHAGKAPPGSLRRTAGWIAVAATQRSAGSFRPADLYATSLAARLTGVLAAVPLLAVAWRNDILGVGLVAVMAIFSGLSPRPVSRLERFVNRIGRGLSENRQVALFLVLGILLALVISLGGSLIESFLRTSLLTSSGSVPLWRHPFEGRGMASWWERNWSSVVVTTLVLLAGYGLAFIVASISDLRYREGFAWLASRRTARWFLLGVLASVTITILLSGGTIFTVGLTFIAAVVVLPWGCAVLGGCQLIAKGYIPGSGLHSACKELVRTGILTGYRGAYRFRHQELSAGLGREMLAELTEAGGLGVLPSPASAAGFIDNRIERSSLEEADRLTEGLLAEAKDYSQYVVTQRVLFLYFGALSPADAVPVLSEHLARNPSSTARIHLPELLDAEGKHAEATPMWSEIFAAYPDVQWVVNKWARRQSMLGDPRGALAVLQDRVRGAETAENAFLRVLVAELQGRFGDDGEVEAAAESLERIRLSGDRYLVHRATLELARLRAELFDRPGEAEDLLRSILDEGLIDSLKYARFAQLRLLASDRTEAEQFASEAGSLLCWDSDPSHQLEVLLTVTHACPGRGAEFRGRIEALSRFGWSLPGRGGRDGDGPVASLLCLDPVPGGA